MESSRIALPFTEHPSIEIGLSPRAGARLRTPSQVKEKVSSTPENESFILTVVL